VLRLYYLTYKLIIVMKECIKCNKLHKRKTNLCPRCYYKKNKESADKDNLKWKLNNYKKMVNIT